MVLGVTIGGFTNRPVGIFLIVVGVLLWIGGLAAHRWNTRDPNRKTRERHAHQIIEAATVTYVGADWGPVPLRRVDLLQSLNSTIDVHAHTESQAREDAYPAVLRQLRDQERRTP